MNKEELFNEIKQLDIATTNRTNVTSDHPLLDTLATINMYERKLLLHSYLYYECDMNVISDFQFDKWAFELVDLMNTYPSEFKQSTFYEGFKDFTGDTGAFLPYKNESTIRVAKRLYLKGINHKG